MVLSSMPKPAWLGEDSPESDVVLSARVRIMRNLRGRKFPHAASAEESVEAMQRIVEAARAAGLELEANLAITQAERDYLVGCRLVSPDFEWSKPGRALLTDRSGAISLMINEEDHLRVQALAGGWRFREAEAMAERCIAGLERRLEFAWSPAFGYLSASPYNTGHGRRLSAMFHLIGCAHRRKLGTVVSALGVRGLTVRGLFGESSRAVGAFTQVSYVGSLESEFLGACDYLIRSEREARALVSREEIGRKGGEALDFARRSVNLELADALRVLAWLRWASYLEDARFPWSARTIDAALTSMQVRAEPRDGSANQERARSLRAALGL